MKSIVLQIGKLGIAICLMFQLRISSAATWEGADDFASGISPSKWTAYQHSLGTLMIQGANGHASYLVAGATSSEQQAFLVWNGNLPASNNWSVEITAHNGASYSSSGASQLQFYIASANDLTLTQPYRISFAKRTAISDINASGGGSSTSFPTTATDAHLRFVYKASTRTVQSWCATNSAGTNWVMLEERLVDQIMPILSTTNQFGVAIVANTYYGPITEGQMWADNFQITNSIASSRVSMVKAIKPAFSNLSIGATYQMQMSSNLVTWSNYGAAFTATNVSVEFPQYFDVPNWNSLFFQLQATP